jgi:deazaflavin-dependent oxidoreductase (nitroreductase family)
VTRPPRTRAILPFTKAVVSPLIRRVAGRLPGFAIVHTRGRRTGLDRSTPVNVFRHGDDFVFALTYGAEADWVRNVLAAGECELVTRGRTYRVVAPELFEDSRRRAMPAVVRFILGLLRVDQFLRMRVANPVLKPA